MGEMPTRRLAHASAVATRDTPIVYFDTAPASGSGHGIVSIALGADCIEIGPNGEVRGDVVVAAYLKCSIPAAMSLRAAIDSALSLARQTPEVAAQAPKVRNN
jgi:hypothetical protein